MNIHHPTAAEQAKKARELKEKFFGTPITKNLAKDPEAGTVQAELRVLRRENEAHKKTIKTQADQIDRLRLEIADIEAAFLCQSHMMVDTFRSASGETERVARRSPRQIIDAILEADYPNISFFDIISQRRTKELIEPRRKCMAAVYLERYDLSFPMLGKIFDRDRTSVMAAVEKEGAKRGRA